MGHDYSPSKMTTHPKKKKKAYNKVPNVASQSFSMVRPSVLHLLPSSVTLTRHQSASFLSTQCLSRRFIPAANGKGQTSGFNVREKGA